MAEIEAIHFSHFKNSFHPYLMLKEREYAMLKEREQLWNY